METKKETKLTWTGVLTMLRDQGVASIVVEYAGSGDSGAIDHVGYLSEAETSRTADGNIDASSYNSWDMLKDITPENEAEIYTFVEEAVYPILNTFDDWWNDDGGQGALLIDTKNGKWYANNGTNYSNVDYTYPDGKLEI